MVVSLLASGDGISISAQNLADDALISVTATKKEGPTSFVVNGKTLGTSTTRWGSPLTFFSAIPFDVNLCCLFVFVFVFASSSGAPVATETGENRKLPAIANKHPEGQVVKTHLLDFASFFFFISTLLTHLLSSQTGPAVQRDPNFQGKGC